MFDPRSQVFLRGAVRPQLVGNQYAQLAPGLEQFPEKAHRSRLVPVGLNENIQNIAICINGPPEPILLAADSD